jgi:hypothetical protein
MTAEKNDLLPTDTSPFPNGIRSSLTPTNPALHPPTSYALPPSPGHGRYQPEAPSPEEVPPLTSVHSLITGERREEEGERGREKGRGKRKREEGERGEERR